MFFFSLLHFGSSLKEVKLIVYACFKISTLIHELVLEGKEKLMQIKKRSTEE